MSSASSSTLKKSAGSPTKYACKWTVANFKDLSALQPAAQGLQYAPRYIRHSKYKDKFVLNCYPKLRVYSSKYFKYFTLIALSMEECDEDVLPVHYEISILDANDVKHHKRDFKADFGKLNRKVNSNADVQYRLNWDYLTDPANGLLVDGSLIINCELYVSDCIQQQLSIEHQNKLSQDIYLLLENEKFTDVSLVVGEKEFKAHKLVLAARSPVFCAMFEHSDTKESQENRVNIEEMSVEVFEQMLRYIYTEKIDSLEQYASELLQAADRYQLDSLKSTCEQYLGASLTVDTVASVVIIADMHNVENLKQKCIDYLIKHATAVVDTDGWKNLVGSRPELGCELFKYVIKNWSK